ncbi:haloacid dehalogenase type II [Tropicimonas sp. TH_r6]|uniref:haloacid dehalogenase type II n=1 Tax=Tropicimonas sp. TH_r6 TaxID=3082085 RepID=UPI00295341F3|nr:haloacid dehalogenase type II [Tropicimonas sp. TH_r6]MDV7145517.1 haloacid dehalogenase type II [Tropicimonas sp. TH_r6]
MIEALIFDVFGTCVDWRRSVAREVAAVLPEVDSLAFAESWRSEYDPAMARVREGARGYVPLEELHLENLLTVAERFGVTLTDPDMLNRAWERLAPWPDVVAGLTDLRRERIIAPCSNGSIALITRMARHAGLPWDCILGAELAQDYKPSPLVYLAACTALRLRPDQVMMVAAHNGDLRAARALGLATGFVRRPDEHGPAQTTDLEATQDWDIVAEDFGDLARQLAQSPGL